MTDRIPQRLDDLLARLTLTEKLGLLHQWQAPVPRLGLPSFRTGTEALHGVPATVFPQVVGLAATSSDLPPRVLHEYEFPAFRAPLEADAAVAVMVSYNRVNGVPAHLSPLIEDELRAWADDEILVVDDAGAVGNIAGVQGHLPDHVEGFAAALRAGIDSFTEDDRDGTPTVERLTAALHRGLISESEVDRAVRRPPKAGR
ncbi:hypothetical protein ONA70_30625 [Micromonospora yasonensis]|uniref:glycoside hydrolase family 3 N-terminal domain-containing protein n=1 Tax=Micromonospora yasonensis TaxID=1128667 RepID=UPI002230A7AD|nr:glycoside hydrolase family 3 N-terminal domain-containing protein [Micromonospora yasonensis]MCW3844451.1 hypothetical protein [Micromonospora yasonensis]